MTKLPELKIDSLDGEAFAPNTEGVDERTYTTSEPLK